MLFIWSFIKRSEWFLAVLLVGQFITHFIFGTLGGNISRNNISDPSLIGGFGIIFVAYAMNSVAKGKLVPSLSSDEFRQSFLVVLIGLMILLSATYAESSSYAIQKGLKYFALNAMPFFLALYALKSPKELRSLIVLIVFLGVMKSLLTLISSSMAESLDYGVRMGEGREIAFFTINSGIWFARQTSLAMLSAVMLAYLAKLNMAKWAYIIVAIFSLFMMLLAASRGPVLSSMLVIPVIFLLQERGHPIRVILLTALAVLLLMGAYTILPAFVLERYSIEQFLKPAGSVFIRLKLYILGWRLFLANPIIGFGAGGFNRINLDPDIWTFAVEGKANYVHNIFLEFAADHGIIGFLLISTFLGHIILVCHWCYRHSPAGSDAAKITNWIIGVFLMGLLNAQVSGNVNTNETIWIAAALALRQKQFLVAMRS